MWLTSVPFFGNAFQLDKDRLHQQLEGWALEFGPAYRARVANRRMLILSDHKVVASVLRDRPERFRRPTRHGQIVKEMGFEDGLFKMMASYLEARFFAMCATHPSKAPQTQRWERIPGAASSTNRQVTLRKVCPMIITATPMSGRRSPGRRRDAPAAYPALDDRRVAHAGLTEELPRLTRRARGVEI